MTLAKCAFLDESEMCPIENRCEGVENGDFENQVWKFWKSGVEILKIRCGNFENRCGILKIRCGNLENQVWKFGRLGVEILKIRCGNFTSNVEILKIRCGNFENQVWKF